VLSIPAGDRMNLSTDFWNFISNSVYAFLALDALWGTYCIIVIYMRIAQKRFRSEKRQDEFLDEIEAAAQKGDYDTVVLECEGDRRAIPQLALLACHNRALPADQLQEVLVDRFQRDVIADLEHRVNWTNNVIKTAPMLGLLGTVLGMMAAFGKIAAAESVKPTELSSDIAFALITTAIGLAIAIPATACVASINIRIRKLEDQVGAGLVRLIDIFSAPTSGGRG
jgi:biopolymer transport protein ExbB/TolQ